MRHREAYWRAQEKVRTKTGKLPENAFDFISIKKMSKFTCERCGKNPCECGYEEGSGGFSKGSEKTS